MGFNVIPVNGKLPAEGVFDHTRWSEERQPESLIEKYEKIPSTGWAIVTGKSSNIVAMDIDSVSQDILSICPPSQYRKVGARGETRFFRWSPEFDAKTKYMRPNTGDPESGKKEEGVEILCAGAYTVMPPSIHPNTGKPYVWSWIPLECATDAEILIIDDVNKIQDYIMSFSDIASAAGVELRGKFFSPQDERRCPHGSQDRLKAMCAALIEQNKSPEECVTELLKYDETHHFPITYFKDHSRSDCKADPYTNALQFYSSILGTINRRRVRRGLAPQIPTVEQIPTIELGLIVKKPEIIFPQSDGLIYAIKSSIMRCSRSGGQDELATGAAIAICSTLASNRFHIEGRPAITHQYIMCVARTGKGKGAAVKIANALFYSEELKKYNLSGLPNYSSNAAFVEHLPTQRQRLDMLDEFGTILKGISGGSDLKKEMEGFCAPYIRTNILRDTILRQTTNRALVLIRRLLFLPTFKIQH